MPGPNRAFIQQLNRQLAGRERWTRPRLVQQIHGFLQAHAAGEAPPSPADVALGLERVERALRTSPLHVGFPCSEKFFNGPGAFFSTGIYANGVARHDASGEGGGERPIYAALNVSERGHKGWGRSCLVLQPHLLQHALLSSCDTGDMYNRYSGQECTPQHVLPIIQDWLQDPFFRTYWEALAGPERTPIPWHDVDMERPVEARLLTPDGRLHPKDIAMVCVNERELNASTNGDPAERREALHRFEAETGIPIVVRQGPEGTPFPEDVPGYPALVKAYAAHAAGLEGAAAAAVASAPRHYTEILAMPTRIKPNWTPQAHI